MKLGLGTVQFGLAYGVAGSAAAVDGFQASRILGAAWDRGVRLLDTAPAYGDIEERLISLCGGRPFDVVSKIPSIPAALDVSQRLDWVLTNARRSLVRLGENLRGLLFHDSEDLPTFFASEVLDGLMEWGQRSGVVIGVSSYDPQLLSQQGLSSRIQIVQVPGNALDQRIVGVGRVDGIEVHLRSAFLQGLLALPINTAVQRVPESRDALLSWADWCERRSLTPVEAALSVVKSFPVDVCLVGVQEPKQFEELADSWQRALPVCAPELSVTEPLVTDPRKWRTELRN